MQTRLCKIPRAAGRPIMAGTINTSTITIKVFWICMLMMMAAVFADVNLTPPPTCYSNCLSSTLAKVGCSFADVQPLFFARR